MSLQFTHGRSFACRGMLARIASGLFWCWALLRNNYMATNLQRFSLLVVRRFDDDATQPVSFCRRMWLLSPKAEAQTRPHTVQADPCRIVVGCGWLRCWCLYARFAAATSICRCSKVASPLTQTARHSSRSPANSSSLSKGIPHLLKDDLMWSLKRFFWPPTERRSQESSL